MILIGQLYLMTAMMLHTSLLIMLVLNYNPSAICQQNKMSRSHCVDVVMYSISSYLHTYLLIDTK